MHWLARLFARPKGAEPHQSSPVDEIILAKTGESDIVPGSELYRRIERALIEAGLNLSFFVFETRERSSCARTVDGKTSSYPVLTLYLQYDADFEATGIDSHRGNWADGWNRTGEIRALLNAILGQEEFDGGYLSDRTYIFVRTLEELAFQEVGRRCKNAVAEALCDEAPGVERPRVFWNGRQFDAVMASQEDYKRVKRKVKAKVANALPKILAAADPEGLCQSYPATLEIGFSERNLFHLIREDL